jgi:hypothetical protein
MGGAEVSRVLGEGTTDSGAAFCRREWSVETAMKLVAGGPKAEAGQHFADRTAVVNDQCALTLTSSIVKTT